MIDCKICRLVWGHPSGEDGYVQYLAYPVVVVTVYIFNTSVIKSDLTEIKLGAGRPILLEVSIFFSVWLTSYLQASSNAHR